MTTAPFWSYPLDDGLVLLRPGDRRLRVLNASARLLWETWQNEPQPGALSRTLVNVYGLPVAQAERDSLAIVQHWRESGLLEPVNPPASAAEETDNPTPVFPPRPAHFPVVGHYRSFWISYRVRFGDAQLARRVRPLLAPLAHASGQETVTLDLFRDGDEIVLCQDGAELARASNLDLPLALLLYRGVVVGRTPEAQLAGLHTAGLASDHGALLLAGNHGSGKSTLAAALCQEGFQYLGDDLIPLLQGSRELAPMPNSICLKAGSWPVLAHRYPGLSGLPIHRRAGRWVRYLPPPPPAFPQWRGYPARLLVFPSYRPDTSPTLTPLSSLEALDRLVASCGLLPSTDDPLQVGELLDWLQSLPTFSLNHADLEQAVAILLDLARDWL